MTRIEVPIPETVFHTDVGAHFESYLRDKLGPEKARGIVRSIVTDRIGQLVQHYVATMRTHVIAVLHIRGELQAKYHEVIAHFAANGTPEGLRAELRPEAFDTLFSRLAREMEALVSPEAYLKEVHAGEAQGRLRPAWEQHASERGLPPAEVPRPEWEVLAGLGEDAERYARGELELDELERSQGQFARMNEQLRAERAQVRARFVEDPQVRARVDAAAQAFADRRGLTARGWKVGITRVERVGPNEAQLRFHSELDPAFAAEGYGITLRRPGPGGVPATGRARAGEVYKPDAVIQSPRGSGYAFGEFKEPLGPQPRSFYDSDVGRQRLFEDMFERVQMSREMGPDCAGWVYDTGDEWLDLLIYEIANKRLGSADAKRIIVPRAKEAP